MIINALVVSVEKERLLVRDFSNNEIVVEWRGAQRFSPKDSLRIECEKLSFNKRSPIIVRANNIDRVITAKPKDKMVLTAKLNPLAAKPLGERVSRFSHDDMEQRIERSVNPIEMEISHDDPINDKINDTLNNELPNDNTDELENEIIYDDIILSENGVNNIEPIENEETVETANNRNRHRNRNRQHGQHHGNNHRRPSIVVPIRPPHNVLPCPNCVPNFPPRPSVTPIRMNVVVLSRQRGSLLVRSLENNQTLVVRTPHVNHFCVGQRLTVTYDIMTMSNPPIVNALDIAARC